jgi:predicted flavoprotein YhiN
MESKIVPGLYFAGEIIDGCAFERSETQPPFWASNLQQAFSTGYLAGENAALAQEKTENSGK